jgi:hypothetical protein
MNFLLELRHSSIPSETNELERVREHSEGEGKNDLKLID